jgi:hypothetical protein
MSNPITPEFRVSYANVFAAVKNDLNGKMEYSVVAIFPKGADLAPLKAAAEKAIAEKLGPDKAKWPANLRHPFRKCKERWQTKDGKEVIPAGYEDGEATFITLKSTQRPGVVDASVTDIIDTVGFYSGCYARASVRAFYYDQKGNKGVSFGLQNIQKTRDGDPLGGRARPSDEFEAVAGSSSAKSVFDDD